MKRIYYILISLICVNTINVLAQNSNFDISSSGTITNLGTINFKKSVVATNLGQISNTFAYDSTVSKVVAGKINVGSEAVLNSEVGNISNEGLIYSQGSFTFSQPKINGDVIFDATNGNNRFIPQASYFNIMFKGGGNKFLINDKELVSRNSFYSDEASPLRWESNLTNIRILVNDSLNHNGNINPFDRSGQIILNGSGNKNVVQGNGKTFLLELDNTLGADVTDTTFDNSKKGGLQVSHLKLTKGQLRNSVNANITVFSDPSNTIGITSGTITRSALGSLAFEPTFNSKLNLQYVGSAGETNIVTGAEVPKINNTNLENIFVENVDGVTLGSSATVSNRLYVNSTLRTYQKGITGIDSISNELLMTSANDPEYTNNYAEVDGKLTRNNLKYDGSPILFNNKFTFAKFDDVATAGKIKKLSFNIKIATAYDSVPYRGFEHIQRTFELSADTSKEGQTSTSLASTGKVGVRFAWRNDKGKLTDIKANETWETAQDPLVFNTLTFQRWNAGGQWADMKSSKNLIDSTDVNWAYIEGEADVSNDELGLFAVGTPANTYLKLFAKAVLQGPFYTAKDKNNYMYTRLLDSNRIPATPPNIYPYNLDSNSQTLKVNRIPKGVVDWVVLEFRDKEINPTHRYFKTCFLSKDGTLLDPIVPTVVALSQISVSRGANNIDNVRMDTTGATPYFIALRHKNHIAVISKDPVTLHYNFNDAYNNKLDFTKSGIVSGNANTMRLLGYDNNKSPMFGMMAGNYPAIYDANGNVSDPNPLSSFFLAGIDGMDEVKPNDYNVITAFLRDQKYPLGYLTEDYDLNGIVNTQDYNISWNNRNRTGSIK